MKATGVGIPHGIEPVHRALFGVARGSKQSIHDFLVGIRRAVGEKSRHLIRRRKKAGEIERDATQQGSLISFLRWLEAVLPHPALDEIVDWVLHLGAIRYFRHCR